MLNSRSFTFSLNSGKADFNASVNSPRLTMYPRHTKKSAGSANAPMALSKLT